MKITFLGGAREVGRSCIRVDGKRTTLMDCGIKISGQSEEHPLLEKKDVKELDRMVLSHAHLDHSGYAPWLYANGCRKTTHMTKPTRDLIQLLYADYLRLAEEKGTKPYPDEAVKTMLSRTEMLEYGVEEDGVTLQDAGHILGSATVTLRDEKRLLYTGDINLRQTRLLEGAALGPKADTLVIESTYGARADRHASSKDNISHFVSLVKKSLEKGGKVLVPSFAIGRGQEVLFTLESFMRSGALPEVPIYLDGMVRKALRIYRHNAIYLKREIQRRILTSDDDPFKSEHYRVPETKDRSDVLDGGPCVIVATSGMLTGGPSMYYLEKLAGESKNAVVLVGYQGEGLLGRKLLDGAREIEINGKTVGVSLQVGQAPLSAHADHDELLKFARSVVGLRKAFVIHGEGSKADELAEDIGRQCGRSGGRRVETVVPELGETHEC